MPATKQKPSAPVEVTPPRSLGAGEAQDRTGLLAAPLRGLPRPSRLQAPLRSLPGVGPRFADAAAELGVETLGDLLLHVPHGYRDRADVRLLGELRTGEEATVRVEVRSARIRPTRRRNLRIVEATVADESGPAKAVWFNQDWLAERLGPGTRWLLHGKLDRRGCGSSATRARRTGDRHPHDRDRARPLRHRGAAAQRIRDWAWQAIPLAANAIEPLPAELRARRKFAGVADALVSRPLPASTSTRRRPPGSGSPSRSSSCTRRRWRHAAATATTPTRDRARSGRRARGRRGSNRCRSSPPATSVARWKRSTPTSAPAARCSGC